MNMKVVDLRPNTNVLIDEIIRGLSQRQKILTPKLLYDARGSELFERICRTREYYVTRLELQILRDNAEAISENVGNQPLMVEFGSGSAQKTRILLETLQDVSGYIPIDVSDQALLESSERLAEMYPSLAVVPVCADFTLPMRLPLDELSSADGKRLGFMPGSTLGNLDPLTASRFLAATRRMLGQGCSLLVGIDFVKDVSLLQAAYNDGEGVTADFNRNVLSRLNREYGANFDERLFEHRAFFRSWESRIEMHLESTAEQWITVAGHAFHFDKGETIHTENSYKYTRAKFQELAESAGYRVKAVWADAYDFFGVFLLSDPSQEEQRPRTSLHSHENGATWPRHPRPTSAA